MNTEAYLKRINYTGELTPSLHVLNALQRCHLLNVPFENLDIHFKRSITLDIERIEHKVVEFNRGGFCYELNGLYYYLLKSLGFAVKMISCRTYGADGNIGQEYDHLAIIVTIEDKVYLTDVGFGEFTFHPLQVVLDQEQQDERGVFKVSQHNDEYLRVSKCVADGNWVPEYIFTTKSREFHEFAEMCHYHQTSPKSHFTKKRMCTLPNADGRITVSGNTLKITKSGAITEEELADEEAFHKALNQYFDIKLF